MPDSLTPLKEPVNFVNDTYLQYCAVNDPHQLYVDHAKVLAKSAEGLELLAYRIFGPTVIGSLAFALDPLSVIKVTRKKVTSPNRTRIRSLAAQKRSTTTWTSTTQCGDGPDPSTPNPFDRTPVKCATTDNAHTVSTLSSQAGIRQICGDTTKRSRGPLSEQGEMEYFRPLWQCPSKNFVWDSSYNQSYAYAGGYQQYFSTRKREHRTQVGPSMTIDVNQIDAIQAVEKTLAILLMQKYAFGLLDKCLPTHRQFQLYYNIAELRDLPMMLRETMRLYDDLAKQFGNFSDISTLKRVLTSKYGGNQYLNLKFGWESTKSAVDTMLRIPETVAKRVNYLISRADKDTSLRYTIRGRDKALSIPSVSTFLYPNESLLSNSTLDSRDWLIRCCVNSNIVFPKMEVPQLREEVSNRLWGARPTPTDLYNLIPWTWLVDWFSGLGEYISLLDAIRLDRSVINYGFLTYESQGSVTYSQRTRRVATRAVAISGFPSVDTLENIDSASQGLFTYKYLLRKDLSSFDGVKSPVKMTGLSSYQVAILGALLSKYS